MVLKLTSIDYEILALINEFDPVHENKIISIFPSKKYATLERLKVLEENKLIIYETELISIKGLTSESPTDICKISYIGRKALQDYMFAKKQDRLNKWEYRIWRIIPLAISIIALLKSYGWL